MGFTRFRLLLAVAERRLGETPVHILRASEDSDLKGYLSSVQALASQSTDLDGRVWIQLDDTDEANHPQLWGAFLEEVAHAIQNRDRGSVPISANDAERNERECEVARCMLAHGDRLKLSNGDRRHYEEAVSLFCGALDAS